MKLEELNSVYFLGIGGIGMSALARYFNSLKISVAGYDRTKTELTASLEHEGISVHYLPDSQLVPENVDLVVYTPAVPSDFEEWQTIYSRNIPVLKRSEVLAEMCNSKKCIAVAGTHGKTTVSAMIAHIFANSDKDFIAFVGGIMNDYNTNIFLSPTAEWAIAEADEFDRSFLKLFPDIAIINAIDADHLDIYGNKAELEKSFQDFIYNIKDSGMLLHNADIKSKMVLPEFAFSYSLNSNADYSADNIEVSSGHFVFDVYKNNKRVMSDVHLHTPGRHNVQNALAAIAAADNAGIDFSTIGKAISSFRGVRRRLELIYKDNSVIYYDDYAHHPTEINALISAVRELYPGKSICGIFQPHLFTRTRDFADDFAQSLSALDYAVVTDIYPAREKPIDGINAEFLLGKIYNNQKFYVPYNEISRFVSENPADIFLTIGAGNIDFLVPEIKKVLESRS